MAGGPVRLAGPTRKSLYSGSMTYRFPLVAALALAAAAPSPAAPASLAFVNATGSDIAAMEARRTGSSGWAAIPYSARSGTSSPATFDVEDCAWDLKVTLAGGRTLTFANVNLCEAQLLTLRQRDGVAWVDYG